MAIKTYGAAEVAAGKQTIEGGRSNSGRWAAVRELVAKTLTKKGECCRIADVVREIKVHQCFAGAKPSMVYNYTRNALASFKGYELQKLGGSAVVIKTA